MYQSKMDKFTIDFNDQSKMCAFNCGANWGDKIISPCCYACMLGYGLNFPKEEINLNIPDLEEYWEKKRQNKIATETKLQTTEAELYKTQAALKSSENENALLKIELEKCKAKALEEQDTLKRQAVHTFTSLKLKADLAQIETINAKSHALDLQKQIERLEMHKRYNETEIDILKPGIATATQFYTIKGEVVKVVEAEAQAEAKPKKQFSVSDITLDPKPEM